MPGHEPCRDATFVVELTPVGRAAVAVVLVAGPQATDVVNDCFKPYRSQNINDIPLENITLGRWNSTTGEELIVCRRTLERIEIHCHGGLAAVGAVIESLTSRGCQHVSWQDWLRTDTVDPIQADAQIALAGAPTERAAAILLDQYQGALATAVRRMAHAAATANWTHAGKILDAVLAYRDVGMHLISPWRVVLSGRTNVGKSSLINALAGFERAIVSHQPGTTRDVVTTATAIDGWPVQLFDTAGLRKTDDTLEAAGVQLAVKAFQTADLILAVEDAAVTSTPPASERDELAALIPQPQKKSQVIRVHNKIDLIPVADRSTPRNGDRACVTVFTSAITGEGISELIAAIGRVLVPVVPTPGSAVPFTAEQITSLDAAYAAVERHDAKGVASALQLLLSSARSISTPASS